MGADPLMCACGDPTANKVHADLLCLSYTEAKASPAGFVRLFRGLDAEFLHGVPRLDPGLVGMMVAMTTADDFRAHYAGARDVGEKLDVLASAVAELIDRNALDALPHPQGGGQAPATEPVLDNKVAGYKGAPDLVKDEVPVDPATFGAPPAPPADETAPDEPAST